MITVTVPHGEIWYISFNLQWARGQAFERLNHDERFLVLVQAQAF